MKTNLPFIGIILGILVVGTCTCLAAACDFWAGTYYLKTIRDTEKRLNEGVGLC